jgi:hypothetical protein
MAAYPPTFKDRTHKTHMERDLPRCRNPQQSAENLIIGSSHFERMLWVKGLPPVPENWFVAGVGGDCAQHVLYRLESKDGLVENLKGRGVKRILFMIGGNNMTGSRPDPARTVATIRVCLDLLRRGLPDARLTVWAPPFSRKAPELLTELALQTEALCRDMQIPFSRALLDKTRAAGPECFDDPVHLSAVGYQRIVIPLIQQTLAV